MKLDHVGIVVANIEESGLAYAAALGMQPAGPPVVDTVQRVRVQFWSLSGDTGRVELIAPHTEDSPVAQFAKKGGGFAHLCFAVPDIEQTVDVARQRGAIVIQAPVPAEAFGKRRIAFVFYRNVGVVEYVEEAGQ